MLPRSCKQTVDTSGEKVHFYCLEHMKMRNSNTISQKTSVYSIYHADRYKNKTVQKLCKKVPKVSRCLLFNIFWPTRVRNQLLSSRDPVEIQRNIIIHLESCFCHLANVRPIFALLLAPFSEKYLALLLLNTPPMSTS